MHFRPTTNEIDREIGKRNYSKSQHFFFVPQVEAIGDKTQSLRAKFSKRDRPLSSKIVGYDLFPSSCGGAFFSSRRNSELYRRQLNLAHCKFAMSNIIPWIIRNPFKFSCHPRRITSVPKKYECEVSFTLLRKK